MTLLTENIYLNIIIIFATIFMSIKIYFTWVFNYWRSKGVETAPPSFLFGNARDLLLQRLSLGDVFRDYYNKMKHKGLKYCGFYTLAQPNFVVLDLDLVKAVMTRDFQYFTDRGIYANEEIDPLSVHLLTLTGSAWKSMRSKLSPTFTTGKMKMMFNTLLDCSKELLVVMNNIAENHEILDVKEVLGRFTTDVIGSCAFGIDCNSLRNPNSEFRKYGKKAVGESVLDQLRVTMSMFAPSVLRFFKLPAIHPSVSKFFINIVKETIRYREENNVLRKDFMHLMIQLKNNIKIEDEDHIQELKSKESTKEMSLTEEQVAAEAFVFFVAGFETSSTTLTFCLYEFASNPDIQEKLRQEVKEVLARHEGKLTYDAIMDMPYMDKCINETLRKYPPIPTIGRICTEAYRIPDTDVVIEKGTILFIPVAGIHYDPEYYADPEKFDPERFSPENKADRHNFAWLGFGEGPRACIGIRFGLMQIKVALSILLQHYRFSLNSKTRIPLVLDPVMFFPTAKGGIWLNAEKI
ncbi:hypothetical protein ILUMI_09727 [Ignelater luminosus]|uniref:Cytochrome P450 n=1 Tax=Ignelater luminosus TaxID=2038154 RepID=A0A8K0D3N9_IGNLU|nr:hypothetical protein ILUMI_09727 [Ignelater luminosus]